MSQAPSESSWWTAPAIDPLLVALLAALPFVQALTFGLSSYDDGYHLHEQAFLHLPPGQALAAALFSPQYHLYSPVTALGFLLDAWVHQAIGLTAGAVFSHGLNLLLHVGASLLVLRLARVLMPGARGAALLAAMLFAWHPLHVEPVVWITARKDLLVGFFALAALGVAAGDGGSLRGWRRLAGLWGFGLLALLAKPTAAFLPLLALAWPLWFPGQRRRRILLGFGPLALAAAAVVGVNLAVKLAALDVLRPGGHDLLTRLWLPLHAAGHHLVRLLLPAGLSPYNRAPSPALADPMFLAAVAALAALAWLLVRARRAGGPALEAGLALAFFLALLPVVNLIPNTPHRQLVESYAYAPSAFACLLAARLLGRLGARLSPTLARLAAGALLLTLGALSLQQAGLWADEERLLDHAAAVSPRSPQAHLSLSNLRMRRGQAQAAVDALARGQRSLPGHPSLINNLAVILSTAGRWPEAEAMLRRLPAAAHPAIRYNLAVLDLRAGRLRRGRAALFALIKNTDLGQAAQEALAAPDDAGLYLRAIRN